MLAVLLLASALTTAEVVPLPQPLVWAREPSKLSFAETANGGCRVESSAGAEDWVVRCTDRTPVKPGEIYAFSVRVSAEKLEEGLTSSAELRDEHGVVLDWQHAMKPLPKTGAAVNVFVVPPPRASQMSLRVVGKGAAKAEFSAMRLERRGRFRFSPAKDRVLEDSRIKVVVRASDASPVVTDKRTGRTWKPEGDPAKWLVVSEDGATVRDGASFRVCDTAMAREWSVDYRLDASGELNVAVSGDGPLDGERPFAFPAPFATQKGDWMILPMSEGMGFPVDEDHPGLGELKGFCGQSICMSFFGVAEDASGAGWMAILDTPDDGLGWARRQPKSNLWTVGPAWVGSWGEFHETRRFRYVFFDRGGHVAMCKRYRAYAKETGRYRSFSEKAKARPNVDLLLGAANVWCWDGRPLEVVSNLHAVGIDRILWSGGLSTGGSAANIKALAALPKTLVGRYDNYQDVQTPELVEAGLRKDLGPLGPAWPDDIAWSTPTGGLAKAWGMQTKDGRWLYYARLCDRRAPDHARRVTRAELATKPFTARFIDTTLAAPWRECRNPAHPMRRVDSRRWRMELLRLFGDEFGLVVGSEAGHDSAVPYCDYFEGMMSIGPYRVPGSSYDMKKVIDEVPPDVAKYQVGEKYRLPLWELVYHECVCAHWWWGDSVGKVPKIWRKRDLFNALYGTMGLYMFDRADWDRDKEKYALSYRTTSPIARATGYVEMTDHQILKPDRSVQRTVFANGLSVTVDFLAETVRVSKESHGSAENLSQK